MVLASSAGAAPRPPGVYPVLVIHRQDEAPHAYVLGCARVSKGGRGVLLGPKACAALLKKKTKLEILGGTSRTTVTIRGAGIGDTCPETNAREPYVTLAGRPEEHESPAFVVAPGELEVEASTATIATLTRMYPPGPGKKVMQPGTVPSLNVVAAFDLDGDGTEEVIVESLGRYQLFRASGELIGTVGCEYG